MLHFLPWMIRGVLTVLLMATNTVVLCSIVFIIAFFKVIIPIGIWRKLCDVILIFISTFWVGNNARTLSLLHKIEWNVQGVETLNQREWYLVISNHQSWVDIIVLQTIFRGRIPFLKFFLKKELIWVPFLGIAWWALDFPFMKRYSRGFLKKNPHLKGKDIEITQKACRKFKTKPVSVMNFVEGTRYTKAKHAKQNSPFSHLLKPKAGGIAFVLSSMGEYLNSLVDVTIVYPDGVKNFFEFLCGKVPRIDVHVQITPITQEILGDYFNDPVFREKFQKWVNTVWENKDKQLDVLLKHGDETVAEILPDTILHENVG